MLHSARQVGAAQILLGNGASGLYLRLTAPLSFWGGVNPETGIITDRNHPQAGMPLTNVIVHLPTSRGSSSSSSVLLECVRLGTGPAALLLEQPDLILTVGAAVAWEIYGHGPTVGVTPRPVAVTDGVQITCTFSGELLLI